MSTNSQSSAAGGANAGTEAGQGIAGINDKLEGIRKGINNFFDESIQPSAKHDSDAGVTSAHRPATSTTGTTATSEGEPITGTRGTLAGGTRDAGGSGQGTSGFSTDAERAASGIKDMFNKH